MNFAKYLIREITGLHRNSMHTRDNGSGMSPTSVGKAVLVYSKTSFLTMNRGIYREFYLGAMIEKSGREL
jgi:hypothetical protein